MAVTNTFPEMHGGMPPPQTEPPKNSGQPTISYASQTASVYFQSGECSRVPWWLWCNLLSVDAPVVAVVWAALFSRASGGTLPANEALVLLLSVWVIYASDRLLDGWIAKDRAALRERHLFTQKYRWALASLVAAASAAISWLTSQRLQSVEVGAGLKLGAVLVLYMTGIHAGRGKIARVIPKEIAVGLLFACGATLPLWSRTAQISWPACLPLIFFALLCSLNCLSIECWENSGSSAASMATQHPLVVWAGPRMHPIAAALGVIASVACFIDGAAGNSRAVLLSVSAAALGLLILHAARTRISTPALRVLADTALLVPALIALAVPR